MAPQLTGDERPLARGCSACGSARATSSLPVPLSPMISTVASVAATSYEGLNALDQRVLADAALCG